MVGKKQLLFVPGQEKNGTGKTGFGEKPGPLFLSLIFCPSLPHHIT
jgi:hypothetical protein